MKGIIKEVTGSVGSTSPSFMSPIKEYAALHDCKSEVERGGRVGFRVQLDRGALKMGS